MFRLSHHLFINSDTLPSMGRMGRRGSMKCVSPRIEILCDWWRELLLGGGDAQKQLETSIAKYWDSRETHWILPRLSWGPSRQGWAIYQQVRRETNDILHPIMLINHLSIRFPEFFRTWLSLSDTYTPMFCLWLNQRCNGLVVRASDLLI